jgi:transposase-like protein
MDPPVQLCPNFYCLYRGKAGEGNIRAHPRTERRFRCTSCTKTVAATRNTPYSRLHKSLDLVTLVLTLLCHGCPRQAIVAAYGLDERTVADWQPRAGRGAGRRRGASPGGGARRHRWPRAWRRDHGCLWCYPASWQATLSAQALA